MADVTAGDAPVTPTEAIPEALQRRLDPGEELLWRGHPQSGYLRWHGERLRLADAALFVPTLLLWVAIGPRLMPGDSPWQLLVLAGIHAALLAPFVAIVVRRRRRTCYAVTRSRVHIVTAPRSWEWGHTCSFPLEHLMEIGVRGRRKSTIWFGAVAPDWSTAASTAGWPGAGDYVRPRFYYIADAQRVCETIKRAQADRLGAGQRRG